MGVPKFFRYISERYPCLSELAREQNAMEFDNLYLDMNGIIHNCTHPDDSNIHFNITEEQMFKDIFSYIDKLFFIIKPQKLFFMAVDGVAPRAKMNQQRSRRFRSAKEAELLEAAAVAKGVVRQHERFDSNCITPGTEFMVRLQDALRCFLKVKISRDPLWQKCRIILSGQDCPGEGEHKIMDYIRYLKTQSDYDPHTQHCIYGLDADLILLGLCTHEMHFVVLREEVKFDKKSKRASLEETRFYLLHLNLLREYLELEFAELRDNNPNFCIGNLIDDWVLMGFLVGNDFVPHLPCMHISTNALPLLYKTYITVYPSLGGNINEYGKLNLERLEKFFEALSVVEFDLFQEHNADLKYFESKQSRGVEAFDFSDEADKEVWTELDFEIQALIDTSNKDVGDEELMIEDEFEAHKRNYYNEKLHMQEMSEEDKRDQAIGYITALQWILDYYYRGVQSWDWYFPHHYAPFISDLKNFKDHKFNFKLGEPFRPFEQLLAVLPAASKQLLPPAYQDLMTSEQSTLIDYYPQNFKTDLNGKQHEWESVVLIPFINEKLLLEAMSVCESNLTAEETRRNRHGPMYQYGFSDKAQGTENGGYLLPIQYKVFCTEKPIWSKEIVIPSDTTVCVELPELTADDTYYAGRPSMKHLHFTFEVRAARVKVFDFPSRNESMILKPKNRVEMNNLTYVADNYLNKVVHIGWPHLIKSKIVAVSDKSHVVNSEGISNDKQNSKLHQTYEKVAQDHLLNRMGIEFDNYDVLVHARTFVGMTYAFKMDNGKSKMATEEFWSSTTTVYPAQGIVVPTKERTRTIVIRELEDFFPIGSKIFFVGKPYYGSEGVVLDTTLFYKCKRIQVDITVLPEPDFTDAMLLQSNMELEYKTTSDLCTITGLEPRILGRVVGGIFVLSGSRHPNVTEQVTKFNIGLMLKSTKKQETRAGYVLGTGSNWFYSKKAITLIKSYWLEFPEIVSYLIRTNSNDIFESDIYPENVGEGKIERIVKWLKEQPYSRAEMIPCGSATMELETREKLLTSIACLKSLPVKTVKLQVKPHLLLKPDITLPMTYKPPRPMRLFDRIIIVKSAYMVPLGSKGTVIGRHPVTDANTVRIECIKAVDYFLQILFDKVLPNMDADSTDPDSGRIRTVPESCVLLICTQNDSKSIMPLSSTSDVSNVEVGDVVNENNNFFKNTNDKIKLNISKASARKTNSTHTVAHLSPPKTVPQWLQQQQQQQPQKQTSHTVPMSNKGSDEFWLPKPDTKIKYEHKQPQLLQQTQQPQQQRQTFFSNNEQYNNNNHTKDEHDDEENVDEPFKTKSNRRRSRRRTRPESDQRNADEDNNTAAWHMTNSRQTTNLKSSNTVVGGTTSVLQQFMLGVNAKSNNVQPSPQLAPQSVVPAAVNANITANTKDCQAETMVLKNLLGINTNATPVSPQRAVDTVPTKVLPAPLVAQPMHAQFKAQLPQPPLGWRSDAQNANNNSKTIIAQPQQQQISKMPYPNINANKMLPIFRPAVPPTYVPPPTVAQTVFYYSDAQGQVKPQQQQQQLQHYHQQQQPLQNFFKSGSLHQQGAFIPLQALRQQQHQQQHPQHKQQQVSTQQKCTMQQNVSQTKGSTVEDTFKNLWLSTPTSDTQQNAQALITNVKTEHKVRNKQQKPPRPSKIAAKFDNIK